MSARVVRKRIASAVLGARMPCPGTNRRSGTAGGRRRAVLHTTRATWQTALEPGSPMRALPVTVHAHVHVHVHAAHAHMCGQAVYRPWFLMDDARAIATADARRQERAQTIRFRNHDP